MNRTKSANPWRTSDVLYPSPFSGGYWRDAALEFKNIRMLILAAIIVAIRVVLKNFAIPVGESLKISVGFPFCAIGGAIYGPLVGFAAGIVSDLIGFFASAQGGGAFNPVYTLIEALSGLIYALLFYKQKITFTRILTTKALINLIINILCNSIANGIIMGKGVYYYMVPAIIKNIVLLPFEVLVLMIFFGALIVPLVRMKVLQKEQNALVMSAKEYVILIVVTVIIVALAVVAAINYPAVKSAFKGFVDGLFGKA